MVKQKVKTQNNQLINWMAYRRNELEEIEEVKQAIKEKTENERAKLKGHRKNVTIATFKIDQLMTSLEEEVEANDELETVLTLDDFDGSNKNIDINLAEGEYKESRKNVE